MTDAMFLITIPSSEFLPDSKGIVTSFGRCGNILGVSPERFSCIFASRARRKIGLSRELSVSGRFGLFGLLFIVGE